MVTLPRDMRLAPIHRGWLRSQGRSHGVRLHPAWSGRLRLSAPNTRPKDLPNRHSPLGGAGAWWHAATWWCWRARRRSGRVDRHAAVARARGRRQPRSARHPEVIAGASALSPRRMCPRSMVWSAWAARVRCPAIPLSPTSDHGALGSQSWGGGRVATAGSPRSRSPARS